MTVLPTPEGPALDLEGLRAAVAADPGARATLAALESRLRAAQTASEAAARARTAFLGHLGHELRTPLNAILGFAQLLRQDPSLGAEQLAHVELIHGSGEQLLALVRDAIDRERHGKSDRSPAFDLHQLVDDLEDMLYLRTERRGLRLRLRRDPGLPRLIRADRAALRQLLLLLLGNAAQLVQDGDLALHLRSEPHPGDPTAARLICELALPGAADGHGALATIVDAEAGLADPHGPRPSLGEELARLQGGSFTAEAGRVRVELPIGLGPAGEVSAGPGRAVVGLAPGQPPYRVLVAEDRWQSRQLLAQALARVGFDVREAGDGEEALAVWERWRPHLIWMDMRMPVLTGLEATQRIKQSPRGRETIVVALTASAFDEDATTARAAGCDDFMRKPFALPEVFARLTAHLGVQYRYEAARPPEQPRPATLTAASLSGLPRPWLTALHRASVQADLAEIRGLIEQIRGETPQTAAALADMADRFTYDRISGLAQAALGGQA